MKKEAVIDDILGAVGAAAMSYGAWMIYPAAGVIVGGALLVVAAAMRGRARARVTRSG